MRTMPFGVCLCELRVCALCWEAAVAQRARARKSVCKRSHASDHHASAGASADEDPAQDLMCEMISQPRRETPRAASGPVCFLARTKLVGIIDPAERSSFYAPSLFTLH